MKSRLFIVLSALAFGISTTVVAQNFSTGSDMMNSGSSLSSNVYGVGATSIDPMAGTTDYNRGPIRKIGGGGGMGQGDDPGQAAEGSPIGAPYIMLLFAAGAAGVVAMRRRRANS